MADNAEPLLKFNGGEEILADDNQDAIYLLRAQLASMLGWSIGTAKAIDSGDGGRFLQPGTYHATPLANDVYVPHAAEMFDPAELLNKSFMTYGGTLLKYRRNADATLLGTIASRLQSITYDNDLVQFSGLTLAAAPAVNPRWDTLEFDLVDSLGTTESRDTEDAASRALTTGTPNKRINTDFANVAFVAGAEAALPDYPALTDATKGRLLSVKRLVGEGGTIARDKFALHVYPPRVAIEDVFAADCHYDTTHWAPDGLGGLSRLTTANLPGLHFLPRRMHAGCRLLAVAISWSVANEPKVYLGRVTFDGSSGNSFTIVCEVSDNDPTGIVIGNGLTYVGQAEWSASSLLASGTNAPHPFWGNGHAYGPLFQDDVAADAVTKLAVGLSEQADTWAIGDLVNFVRFVYAY